MLAVLLRGAKMPRGGQLKVGPPPPKTPGVRYKATVTIDPKLPAGQGSTSFWGNVQASSKGTAAEQQLVLLHERVHQFLTPKFYLLRNFRVANRAGSYFRSSLWRYVEEALAETIAQIGVRGVRQAFTGIRFSVANGYVFLTKGGGYGPAMTGAGVVPEGAGLIGNGVIQGIAFQLWFSPKEQ